ncbi:oxidoreductase domain-containing protein [Clostridium putrefaciens]|uniref:Oxidoreductase domain-containing protein n=1 Tax=Clostridium putrefaciens TaxID=99675 RepID=A0A381J539_9CLOT|nr:Gfo/Idh/MocA family oxidoreductase [Clostridium putrefaciens]SUY45712.1 oxidoreductase domain-containing protein [Clostridium putrefaciens]
MRVAVIGLGSMGKRRIRLIHKYREAFQIVGIDTNKERRKSCEDEYGIQTFNTLTDAIDAFNVECVFVCTSPLSHSKIISECLNHRLHVFTELNLVDDGYEENIILAKQNNCVLFMSSTFLYREEIKKIKNLTQEINSIINYTYHIGQYLPDWHPWESYKDFFVGNKRSNGCREIFAIELPWLIDVFGEISKIDVVKSKISNLNIDYNDNYLVIIQHKDGHKGSLAVDVISRKAVRNLEVFGEDIYIHWDGSPTGLYTYDFETKEDVNIKLYEEIDQLNNYSSFVVENAYLNEVVSFFEAVIEGKTPAYTFQKDKDVLKIIDRIED